VYLVSISISIKVRKELVELADKMVRYGLARSRSHAFNIMIEKGLRAVAEEVGFWDQVYREAEEMARRGIRIRHGGLNKLLEEDRSR
jgi:metal-responsive CopG/Arc/MetJ family transcriptional regulator